MKDEILAERVIGDLHDLRIINKRDVCLAKVCRFKYAYIIGDFGRRENLKIIRLLKKTKNWSSRQIC